MDPEYTIEEAAAVLEKAVERKRLEIASLEKRKRRLRKESSIAETQELIDYLEADVTAYLTVIADMKDDDTILEGLERTSWRPTRYAPSTARTSSRSCARTSARRPSGPRR